MKAPIIILIIVLTILLIIGLVIYLTYKSLIKNKKQIEDSFEELDNHFKERWILIPNLISILKRYIKGDNSLEELIKLRNNLYNKKSKEEKVLINRSLENILTKLLTNLELHQELKVNKNYIDLQNKLKHTEVEIEKSINSYNTLIENYNNKLKTFPSNIIAKILKYKNAIPIEIEKN